MFVIFSVFYILIAASMIVLILMQRGAGADAGSGFGSGASATVFGARGSASFLTRATAILAALFFLLSLGMGIYLKNFGAPHSSSESDLGVMAAGVGGKPAATQNAQSTPAKANTDVPQATKPAASDVPAASNNKADVPAPTPAAPAKQN